MPQVDYAALAKQHGGTPTSPPAVDYAALAGEFGGQVTKQPAAAQPPASSRPTGPTTVYGAIGEGVKGAAAGLASTVFHGGDLIRRGLGMERVINTPAAQAAMTPPQNLAGKVGYGAEQLAEVIGPMGAVSKATKGANLATRMAAEGGSMAAIAAAQGGDPLTAGAIGAVIPAIGAAVKNVPASLRESAQKKVAQALGATKERFKAIAEKRAPEILKRGLGGTRTQLLADATAHAKAAGQAVDDVLRAAGDQRVATGSVVDALEEAKAAFQQVRRVPMAEAVRTGLAQRPDARVIGNLVEVPVVLDARPIEQLSKLQQTIRELGDDASVEQLRAVRKVWDDVVARAGGFAHREGGAFGVPLAEQTEAWAKREATSAIRKVFAAEVPDLAKVNAEYAFWKDLKDVLTATQKRTQAQGPGLQRMVSAAVGAGAGFSSGGDMGDRLKNAVLGGIVAPKAVQALTSAKWRFVDAGLRNALADAIESGSAGRILGAIARVSAVQGSKAVSPSTLERTTGTPGR